MSHRQWTSEGGVFDDSTNYLHGLAMPDGDIVNASIRPSLGGIYQTCNMTCVMRVCESSILPSVHPSITLSSSKSLGGI